MDEAVIFKDSISHWKQFQCPMITCGRMLDQSVFNLQIKNLAVVAFCVKLLDCKGNELVMQTSMIINLILQ